jgi:hypothetical protein
MSLVLRGNQNEKLIYTPLYSDEVGTSIKFKKTILLT